MKVLFVCTGNICRSPTAEGVLRHYIEKHGLHDIIEVDSAGIHNFHIGEAPDSRSQRIAKKRGVSLAALRARKIEAADYEFFDLILAMDQSHLDYLKQQAPSNKTSHLHLFLNFAGKEHSLEVPDPYYGDDGDFEYVYDLIDRGVQALIKKVSLPVGHEL
ncbi:MAG: low molecular weight phosphotyrosine protein phosphatase [Alphaproteobacteria bacterium]|nr:low molecular weight phosphotyrosine protein phosphatase [Alphaproteobacteria bacterium]